jgi:putative ABC transport system substrate-binding protein
VLKGGLPRDLPVEEPSRFTLSINMRTAATLGLNVPGSVLMRADEVIE